MSSGGDAIGEDLGLVGGEGSGASSSGSNSGADSETSGAGDVERESSVVAEALDWNWEDMNRDGNKIERRIPMKLEVGSQRRKERVRNGGWAVRRTADARERTGEGGEREERTKAWELPGRG